MLESDDWQTLWFTVWVSVWSVGLILLPGMTVAWLLARCQWRGKALVETLVALPLVMPPVATGLILLKCFGRRGYIGGWLHEHLGMDVIFTWRAVLIALGVMAFPLLVRSIRTAFEAVPVRYENVALTLGANRWQAFLKITLPMARRGIIAGMVLAFARALGEFGATMLVAGYIPGKTSTLSLEIYQSVQTGNDARAFSLMIVCLFISFAALWISEFLSSSPKRS